MLQLPMIHFQTSRYSLVRHWAHQAFSGDFCPFVCSPSCDTHYTARCTSCKVRQISLLTLEQKGFSAATSPSSHLTCFILFSPGSYQPHLYFPHLTLTIYEVASIPWWTFCILKPNSTVRWTVNMNQHLQVFIAGDGSGFYFHIQYSMPAILL